MCRSKNCSSLMGGYDEVRLTLGRKRRWEVEKMLATWKAIPQAALKFYLLYREYGLQETILIAVRLFFCIWLFERV